ncbi:MAG: aminoacyl-histidine dipeptidase [Terriglobales bacterium]
MNTALDHLEPKALWKHFAALAAIPRGSGNEAAARRYVIDQATRLRLDFSEDSVGNLVVRKPARPGRDIAATAALQGHLDMVNEKNEDTVHDFEKDPIRLVRDGDWLKADGTTLGADNGIGVASALAVMESTDIAHGRLEFVFTIDEERGLTGASNFAPGLLKAKYFLNLDGEEEGAICIGCAGGLSTVARRKMTRQAAPREAAWRIKVSGLKGGHSGVDIHLGRGNAVRVLGRVLDRSLERLPAAIADMQGGSKLNAIPREASAIIVLDGREQELKSLVAEVETEVRAELGTFDPGVQITVTAADRPETVLEAADAKLVAGVLNCLPHGVIAMSPDVPGLVQTSTNIATVSTGKDAVEIGTSQRSSIESSKMAIVGAVCNIFRLAGFEIQHSGGYPGWKPEPNSELVQKLQAVHEQMFGKKAGLVAMHAGLECGVIGEKYPGMQMVSFGPQIENPHSPNERLKISSVEPFWRFLTTVLERI